MRADPARSALDLVFMGTPGFAATVLEALTAAGHRIVAVYTQPPRPAGRGHRARPSPVHTLAARGGLVVRAPASLRTAEEQAAFAAFGADAAVVAAYGLILPRPMLAAPRLGCLNVHASLLPRWRGAAPVERALMAGDDRTGITIMAMEEGLDTGPILMQQAVPIGPGATAGALAAELALLGGRMIVAALDEAAAGRLVPRPQPPEGVTYAHKIGSGEGRLDWRRGAAELERLVRALDPRPGAWFEAAGERIRVLAAALAEDISPSAPSASWRASSGARPGTVLDDRLAIACGEGVLRLLRLQRPGRNPLAAAELLRGFPLAAGTVLPCPVTS